MKEKYSYFHPGEMLFHVSHKSAQLSDDQINSLFTWSNEQAKRLKLTISRRQERELRLPAMPKVGPDEEDDEDKEDEDDEEKRSLLKDKEYKSPRVKSQDPFALIFATVEDSKNPDKYLEDARLVELILLLDDDRQGHPLGEDVTLEAVIPNWLSSPGSELGGGGGPGARPVPYRPGAEPVPYQMNLPPFIEKLCPKYEQRGTNVKVAILDTAPCVHDLVAAYERWQKVNPALSPVPNHELIKTLLRPNGPLHVYPATPEELFRMRAIHLRDHNYIMTDHGLFVAGIINSIAPAAEIHVYEVLNPNGVGDLQTIADGLTKVFNSFTGDLLVVNCSLVLNIPLPRQRITDLDPSLIARIYPGWTPDPNQQSDFVDPEKYPPDMKFLERQGQTIQKICNLLYSRNSRVIAAAGNDRMLNQLQPQARYPAAFESVVGVGALPKQEASRTETAVLAGNTLESSYSNVADLPASVGITTLGGEPGEGQGVLGVYIGTFPLVSFWQLILNWLIKLLGGIPGRNDYDWAWWAGTSFATPILTGVIAAVLSGPAGYSSVEQAIVELYTKRAILQDRPGLIPEDRLLEITQG